MGCFKNAKVRVGESGQICAVTEDTVTRLAVLVRGARDKGISVETL